ncbi:hypothetical protein AB0N24_23800 [Arthrobacter sp. NPDC093128]|uniref:hypothetical protein n=1 Tax=Arthrobacter sp. NPDC093128 TaxID=3154979 RepID=UPI00342352D9
MTAGRDIRDAPRRAETEWDWRITIPEFSLCAAEIPAAPRGFGPALAKLQQPK